uniref:Growth arrest-specific 1a n=1 Tax=Hucho hucho TaxID=62062 RepID=A0A4W5L546_9TELE
MSLWGIRMSLWGIVMSLWGIVMSLWGIMMSLWGIMIRRLICWQADMNCQTEPECHYTYGQYICACAAVRSGDIKKCPSHCISSQPDEKWASLPSPDWQHGETEARRKYESNLQCSSAMRNYLIHCGKLFNGATCTNACRNVIAGTRKIPKAELLDTCVCDGTERTICEYVKVSMKNLCFEAPVLVEDGSGTEDYEEDDGDFPVSDPEFPVRRSAGSCGCVVGSCGVLATASILVLLAPLNSPQS